MFDKFRKIKKDLKNANYSQLCYYVFFNIFHNFKVEFNNEISNKLRDLKEIINWILLLLFIFFLLVISPISVPLLAYLMKIEIKKDKERTV